jgi:hypothetical protein
MPTVEGPTIVQDEEQALTRAIYKWVKFMRVMWAKAKDEDDERRKTRYNGVGMLFRVVIIILAATITVISDVPRTVITITAGIMTALTGIEAYFKFTERGLSIQQQQREIQSLRDELRYKWMVEVELEIDDAKRLGWTWPQDTLHIWKENPPHPGSGHMKCTHRRRTGSPPADSYAKKVKPEAPLGY